MGVGAGFTGTDASSMAGREAAVVAGVVVEGADGRVVGVDVVGGTVLGVTTGEVAVTGDWYRTNCDGSATLNKVRSRASCGMAGVDAVRTRDACAVPCCNNKRGNTNTPPQRTTATPRRLL